MPNQKRTTFFLQLNLAFTFAFGLLVFWSYIREPSEPDTAVIFGFSYLRLILILVVLSLLLTFLILLFGSFRNTWRIRIDEFMVRLSHQKGILWICVLWMAAAYIFLFLSERQLGSVASYRDRVFPILIWFTILAVQFSFVILCFRGINPEALRGQRGVLISALIVFVLLGALLLIIAITRIGLIPDRVYWQGPGVPILLHQVFLATFAGVLFYLVIERSHLGRSRSLDLLVFLALWAFASLVWLNQPAKLTHFSLEPTPPNYQSYPFSDALLYDHTALEFLIGKPIPSDFWAKPLYSFFLAILHLFSAGDYTFLISLQVMVLAVIPAIGFLLTTRLAARMAGLIVALLLILRERNALALSNVIQVSHVKLLLSDVFAMGFMVLLLWLFFHWVEKPGERRIIPLVFGGILSLLVLTRGHPLILLPLLLCAVLLVPFARAHMRWEALGWTLLGFLLPLLPWFWRNYELTGKLAFQYPVSPYSAQMSRAYSFTPIAFDPEDLPARHSGESDLEYYDRLQGQAFRFAMEHPGEVTKFISAHYFHNLIFSTIYLPYSFQIEDVKEYVKVQPFWSSWVGDLSYQTGILLFINLAVVALGLGTLWKKYKHLAFVPLLLGIGYNLSVSVGRLSGWRFILPADWITLIYYAIGLMQIYFIFRAFTTQEEYPVPQEHKTRNPVPPLNRFSYAGFALFFLLIGFALTHGQELFSQRYPVKTVPQLREDYVRTANSLPSTVSSSSLDHFLKIDGALITYGQAFNVSFLQADQEGLDESWPVYYFWPSYKPRPFSRVIFNLHGPTSAGVILPMQSPPPSFPDGSDVIVVGCLAESGEVNALAVLIQSATPAHYISEPLPTLTCPLSETD
jgi:hypothetical protein